MKKKFYLLPVLVASVIFLFYANEAQAKTVEVKTQDEITEALDNMTEDTTLVLKDDFYEQWVNINYESPYKLTIDGKNRDLKGEFEVNSNQGEYVHFKNMIFDGSKTVDYIHLGIFIEAGENTSVIVEKSKFINLSAHVGIPLYLGDMSDGLVDNVLFENNDSGVSGGIGYLGNINNLTIQNSTFITKTDFHQDFSAILFGEVSGDVTIKNSKFLNKNKLEEDYADQSIAIAIHSIKKDVEFNIDASIFDGYFGATHSPSAPVITVHEISKNSEINIRNSTFSNNTGFDEPSVMTIKYFARNEEELKSNLNIENSTFYNNISINRSEEDRVGTILMMNEETTTRKGDVNYTGTNNTFYNNRILSKIEGFEPKGAALNFFTAPKQVNLVNELFTGNAVEKEGTVNTNSAYSSTFIFEDAQVTQEKSIDFDNGVKTDNDVEKVYGKYPVTLSENQGKVKAGRAEDEELIKTVPIAPKLLSGTKILITGLANETANAVLDKDQRGFKRLGKNDVGAVEISSLVYDSNGGTFTLPELTKYDGKTYYEGKNPTQYAKVSTPGGSFTMIDGKKVLNPTKTNHEFLGWSTNKGAKLPDATHAIGKKVVVDDQLVLYAVWKEKKYNVNYYGNGNTTGVEPTQKAVATNTKVTVKKVGTLKKKGYKFAGWASKATSHKAEVKLAPGEKVTVTKKTQFYAVWKR